MMPSGGGGLGAEGGLPTARAAVAGASRGARRWKKRSVPVGAKPYVRVHMSGKRAIGLQSRRSLLRSDVVWFRWAQKF
jgi:hypothetical protein